MGGLLRKVPFIGTALIMAMLAGCGLPGFANFVGEISVLFGAWTGAFGQAAWFVAAAAWGGLVIGAIYMLRAVRRVLHGELTGTWEGLADAAAWRRVPFVLLLGALLLFGFWPRLLSDQIKPSAEKIVALATAGMNQAPVGKAGGPGLKAPTTAQVRAGIPGALGQAIEQ